MVMTSTRDRVSEDDSVDSERLSVQELDVDALSDLVREMPDLDWVRDLEAVTSWELVELPERESDDVQDTVDDDEALIDDVA